MSEDGGGGQRSAGDTEESLAEEELPELMEKQKTGEVARGRNRENRGSGGRESGDWSLNAWGAERDGPMEGVGVLG